MKTLKSFNILYFTLSGQMVGGGQRSLFLLMKQLNKERFNPLLVCPSEGQLVDKARALGSQTMILDIPPLRCFNVSIVFKLIRLIREKRIDLVHTDSPRHTLYLGIASKFTRTPLVWHVRVGEPQLSCYDRLLFSLADRLIVVSGACKGRFKNCKPEKKMVLIYNGVDLSEFGPTLSARRVRKEFGISDRSILIGTVGQLLPRKGQETFLKAAALVSKISAEDVRFMIVGEGDRKYTEHLQREVYSLGLENKVIFTGFRNDIPHIMAALDIFVLASDYIEGFSRVIVEAMASGKPVIATDVGGNSEAVIDGINGFLVSPGDYSQLARAILDLIRGPGRRIEMGKQGRRRVERLFDISQNVARTEKLYEELLCFH